MEGKVVLVSGADGALGKFATQAFLDAGATVIGTSRKIQPSNFRSPSFTALPAEISTREGPNSICSTELVRADRQQSYPKHFPLLGLLHECDQP